MTHPSPIPAEVLRYRAALSAGLETPLSALRATLEALSEDGADPALTGALREVLHLAKGVRELSEFAAPPTPRPLRCSAEEIAYAARYLLDADARTRVWVAQDGARGAGSIDVDGPVASCALARILETVLAAGADRALMRARRDEDGLVFAVVGDGRALDPQLALEPFGRSGEHDLGLGLFLARRDLEVLGGAVELADTPLGDTCVLVRIPNAPARAA